MIWCTNPVIMYNNIIITTIIYLSTISLNFVEVLNMSNTSINALGFEICFLYHLIRWFINVLSNIKVTSRAVKIILTNIIDKSVKYFGVYILLYSTFLSWHKLFGLFNPISLYSRSSIWGYQRTWTRFQWPNANNMFSTIIIRVFYNGRQQDINVRGRRRPTRPRLVNCVQTAITNLDGHWHYSVDTVYNI